MISNNLLYKFKRKFFPATISSNDYVRFLKSKGINIGKGTYFFGPASTEVDIQRPWMLQIGEYCKITSGVKILCHDYSRSVLRRVYGEIIGEAEKTVIGNNVFIGVNSILLMGCCIGDNVIIGAGSVVHGNVPPNCVIAGNPAKIIRSLDDQYKLRKSHYIDDAKQYAASFYETYHRVPNINEIGPFWPLFMERNISNLSGEVFTRLNGDDEKDIIASFLNSEPTFENYKEFLRYCGLN